MQNLLILGAGRSATALIHYLLEAANENNWQITVADNDINLAEKKVSGHPKGRCVQLDATDEETRQTLVKAADVVISMLPPSLHLEVAKDCIQWKKHLLTASYVSKEIYDLDAEVRKNGLLFMGELGLDPGLDHMSAMQKIHQIKSESGRIHTFKSYTGGLVAPESDDNPWHYKISWNPRNVVLAGQGVAQFLENQKVKFLPYNRLFKEATSINVPRMGKYEVYANRDSLHYLDLYDLKGVKTLIRGTIRHKEYCKSWDALVRLGLTDNSITIANADELTYEQFTAAFLSEKLYEGTTREKTARFLGLKPDGKIIEKLDWLGLFSKTRIPLKHASPAQIMEDLLIKKWGLKPDDKDMVIMQHEFGYQKGQQQFNCQSTLVMKGENSEDTAMAKLVGLPLGVFAKMVLNNEVRLRGVQIPVTPEVYNPVLAELKSFGIKFHEIEKQIG